MPEIPITFELRPNAFRESTNPRTVTFGYVATGVFTMGEADVLAHSSTSSTVAVVGYGTLWRSNVASEEKAWGVYHVDVTYAPYEQKEVQALDLRWSVNQTGGTTHLTQAIKTVTSYMLPDGKKINTNGAIGVNEKGDVEGIDVIDPTQDWTENYQLPLADYGWTYMQTLYRMRRTVNNATFRGLEKGCVLFKGATGQRSNKDPLYLDLCLNFSYEPPLQPQTIAGIRIKTAIEGWLVKDFMYKSVAPTGSGSGTSGFQVTKKLVQIDVKQVYAYADFSQFGAAIGTGPL